MTTLELLAQAQRVLAGNSKKGGEAKALAQMVVDALDQLANRPDEVIASRIARIKGASTFEYLDPINLIVRVKFPCDETLTHVSVSVLPAVVQDTIDLNNVPNLTVVR